MGKLLNYLGKVKYWFVKNIYADHNSSKTVKTALASVLDQMPSDFTGLNIGAGMSQLDPRIKTLEIEDGPGIDLVGSVEDIPSDDNQFDLIVTQEVLEHVEAPFTAMKEIYRVLKPGGLAYIQLPFVIGYHPCPHDYWRFTHEGMQALASSANLKVEEISLSVGPAVGFYRILVEFVAVLFSSIWNPLYKPFKIISAIVFFPIKFLDPLMRRSKEADRIAGGYLIICRKG